MPSLTAVSAEAFTTFLFCFSLAQPEDASSRKTLVNRAEEHIGSGQDLASNFILF